jgi:hypothetical protein
MITVQEVIPDPDMIMPQPFTVQRTLGQWALGGFTNVFTTTFQVMGPVRNASDRDLSMLAEADRVGQMRAFYSPTELLIIRGSAPAASLLAQTLTASGNTLTLSAAPAGDVGQLFKNGILQIPGVDYTLVGLTITLATTPQTSDKFWFQSTQTVNLAAAQSDVLLYEGSSYRVMGVYRVAGSGYWKALATRLEAD